ncbi:ClpXP protease specificity-enhancing factor [Haemophilus paracuniculus]|uniref:ClpXP protease specificity-enhancing factor n=1 Tax=Haemophilus paracuniculus TaxID=734 RepID=A0A1T0AS72_9PAST|nr:ClpXP protease specificity-enhancing factor [Haemophilus paracuniculus]OOR99244.1 ClpXP protease specificity-enhancing factor [Haemophilus paracuniculus]
MKPLRPYLYHAYYNWIIDNDLTPYLLVDTDYPDVDVPIEFIKDGKIILNIAPRSIGQYVVDDEAIRFSARFQGMLRDLYIPFGAAVALYAQESGDGVMFQEEEHYSEESYLARHQAQAETNAGQSSPKKKSHLKLV